MSETAPIIIAGHSHVVAIIGEQPPGDPAAQPATTFANVLGLYGNWPRGDAYWQKLCEMAEGANIALVWRGNEHNEFFFFQSNQPFDFVSPDVNQIMTTFKIVPQRRVQEKFRPSIKELETVVAKLKKASPRRIVVVGTPPPKGDNEALRQLLQTEPHFVQWATHMGKSLDEVPITPPRIRLKLWYLLQRMLEEGAKKCGVAFISVPKEATDNDGFLLPEFWAHDVTHANTEYGKLMAERIVSEFSGG